MSNSKFDTHGARVIISQLYVAKRLSREPAKTIKFITKNRKYFPNITNNILFQIQKEHNISNEDLDNESDVEISDLNSEEEFEKKIIEKSESINNSRKEDNRDHRGKGQGTEYVNRE